MIRISGLLHRSLKLKPEGSLRRLMRVHRVWFSPGWADTDAYKQTGTLMWSEKGGTFTHKHRWAGTIRLQPVQSPSHSPEASLAALFHTGSKCQLAGHGKKRAIRDIVSVRRYIFLLACSRALFVY